MKSIMLSVQPQWLAKILNGEKTIEIRKTAPKELPCEVYLYCTKNGEGLYKGDDGYFIFGKGNASNGIIRNGLVVAKFTANRVTKIISHSDGYATDNDYTMDMILHKACLEIEELVEYFNDKDGYALAITNLVIFDKPMELKEFATWNETKWSGEATHWIPLAKAPQSFCYVEVIK
jgi:predicted transcriptional regulator